MAASEREAALLARVAANHLFLAQFEPLRAALLSLRRRADPDLAADFLRAVVASGGRVPGVLWSAPPACPSPSHLAWLAALELAALPSTPNPEALRIKAEFLLLLQPVSDDPATGDEARGTLAKLLGLGVARLKREVESCREATVSVEEVPLSEEDLRGLWGVILDNAELFDALCAGVSRQIGLDGGSGANVLMWLRRSVQLAHLDAMKALVVAGDFESATGHLRFLCLENGVDEDSYKVVVGDLVKKGWEKASNYCGTWVESRNRIIKIYGAALQSSSPQLVQLVQTVLDDILSEEFEDHSVSDAHWMPVPFKKFLETLWLDRDADSDDRTILTEAIISCKKDLYHYSRLSGKHVLEVVMETALSLIKREQLQEAVNVVSLFPLLQPLVAVLGWDILKGKTALRRKLMQLFWTSKSQALRLEEYSQYRMQTDETSCEEYLCDLLCFHLYLACFVSSVNSGHPWNLRNSLLFSQQEQDSVVNAETLDPFVENMILERLAVQTPMRVLFDVVPEIKFQDAIELVGMQPLASTTAASKRMHDIELMHMRYALQSVALALGEMEKCGDGNEHHYHIALSYLKDMQNFMDAIKSTPRKIFMGSIVLSLLHMDDSIKLPQAVLSDCDSNTEPEGKNMVISFVGLLLDILRQNVLLKGPDMNQLSSTGEEAVQRFSLPAEDKASLELAEWVAGAYRRALVEDAVNRATDNTSVAHESDILSFRAQLGPLTTILLCIDVAATSARVGQKQRPLGLLHQMIDDAFKGKRQFLNGKLHNVARAIVDEDSDKTYSKEGIKFEKKDVLMSEKGVVLGHGLRILKQASRTDPTSVHESSPEHKGSTNRYLGPVSTKPSTYLSNFIIYVATIGDIVDGADTTHDFNYFTLVYERPKDDPLYPLQLNLVKHLAQLSSVRAVLACVFGSSILSSDNESCPTYVKYAMQATEVERSFYEFALEQSERYPTLNRWIQMQSNLHRVSESAVAVKTENEVAVHQSKGKFSIKRAREPDSDAESELEDVAINVNAASSTLESPKHDDAKAEPTTFISFDWENEGPYEKAVERLINEGKLTDARAVSDRCLRSGASDKLLQLLIDQSEEISLGTGQFRSYGSRNLGSNTWQYCLRLRDKSLAAQLALKYLHSWDLDAATNVLTMCICHLPENDPARSKVLQMKQSLQRYGHIMNADDRYTRWQEVEIHCEDDPEGLALRLAAKGAVSAALQVAESASLSIDLRRELQGRQLVKLLTTDPLSGGGPAAASRFLSTLRDSNDALPVAIGAMKLLPDLRSKQLLVHFFLKRTVGNLSDAEIAQLNSWALGFERISVLEDDKLIIAYAKKAISVNVDSTTREPRLTISASRAKQKKFKHWSQHQDELFDLLAQADMWLGRAELLQSLLGSGIIASLDDIADKESSTSLRDRLVSDERYSMAVYTSKKCKIDPFPVWVAWGHALVRMEHYAQARVKFK
ncbi:hypothetical protein ACQ4PT_070491 [Festuca glaucescens]